MALNDLELSLMAFPQGWDAVRQQLKVNLMLLPVGNPLSPLGTGPQFAGTTVALNAAFIAGLGSLPSTTSPVALTVPYSAVPPVAAVSLFNGLLAKLPPGTTVNTTPPAVPATSVRIKKSLPTSYTTAFAFERPRNSDFVDGDGYGCALAAQSPGQLYPPQGPPPRIIAWGQILSYALRQPQLALALGLIYQVTLDIPAATLANGGWLYFALDTSTTTHPWVNDFEANADTVKSYAARIPQLDAITSRGLFAATLFPVVKVPGSDLAEAQLEAEIYDDGFAQIVHCNQPTSVDAATGDGTQIAPGAEAGIQIGWDDEQVTIWFNRQVDLLRLRLGVGSAPESPLGVLGYRPDIRLAGTTSWFSLCNVTGSLPFSGSTSNGSGSTSSGELWVAPAPIRPVPADWISPNAEQAWLPLYFSQWRGSSIVVHDDTISQISPGTTTMPSSALTGDLTGVPVLRYGNDYNLRVRFVDLTGGGPLASDRPVHPGLAPTGFCPFRRYLPPKSLEVDTAPPPPPPTIQDGVPIYPRPEATRTITTLTVRRPHIGYPEAIFAGVPPPTFTGASLAALLADAQSTGRALSVPDPDVDRFEVTVEARIPAHDTGIAGELPGQLDGDKYRIIYSIVEHFPGGVDPTVTLSLNYVDTEDIAKVIAPPDDSPTLLIPTGRDIRIRLQPLSAVRSNYYGTPEPPPGLISDYIVRKEAASEADLFPIIPEVQLRAFYLQPGGNLPQLLAQDLGLSQQGLTLSGALGKRTAFGGSGALRFSLAPDGGAITFANQAELLGHWIVAFVIDIARDWTWDGFAAPALKVFRDLSTAPVGYVDLSRTVPPAALGGTQALPDRTTARLIFFDALKPDPAPSSFPAPLNPQYRVVASFASAPALQVNYNSLVLPITTPSVQTPRIASTGIAESAYKAAPDYSQSFLRDRYLWIEFDQPLADPDDMYFGRVLAYGPDPLLAARLLPPAQLPSPIEPPLPIDPEPIRAIFATQASDESGLDAMTPLTPALASGGPDGVHFILPLPEGIPPDALDLFGFWTYEFRVGHANEWSTAQGRYGRPLRITGIQHPAPHLICSPNRNKQEIFVSAPYATTVLNGVRVYDLQRGDPQTVIWFMLYAQVLQTDGASYRNILLAHQEGKLLPDPPPLLVRIPPSFGGFGVELHTTSRPLATNGAGAHLSPAFSPLPVAGKHTVNRDPRAFTIFPEKDIESYLSSLSLPLNSPVSVLAVELLPGQLNFGNFDRPGPFAGQPARAGAAEPAATAVAVAEDPLGTQLGLRRILRTSPLTQVPPIC
jgi:hypothetical protein